MANIITDGVRQCSVCGSNYFIHVGCPNKCLDKPKIEYGRRKIRLPDDLCSRSKRSEDIQ